MLLKVWDDLYPRGERNARRGAQRVKRAAGGASERSELSAGGLAVAAEGSGLRVLFIVVKKTK